MKIGKCQIADGDFYPSRYYGWSYSELYSLHEVFYPIPFNYIVRLVRGLRFMWDAHRTKKTGYDARIHNAISYWQNKSYDRGLKDGELITMRRIMILNES